jgi:hypothetical protein
MDLRERILGDHARLHSAGVANGRGYSLLDPLLTGLADAELRARPRGLNSVGWILWHMTRFEDVVVNVVLQGVPDLLSREHWYTRLELQDTLVGTGSGDDEVRDFSERVHMNALLDYRSAVGGSTRAWLADVPMSELDAIPDLDARLSRYPGAFDERSAWVQALWQGWSGHDLLALPIIGHGHIHLGEARVTRSLLGAATT